jgi:hypothetical protein
MHAQCRVEVKREGFDASLTLVSLLDKIPHYLEKMSA